MKPVAYVINLNRRPDRWQRTQDLWSPFFNLIRVPATDIPDNGARGCKLSHVSTAKRVLANEATMIVLEDDAIPTQEMSEIGLACIEEATRHFTQWQSVNLSPLLDLSAIGLPCAELSTTRSPLFLRTTYSHSTNFVMYNHTILPALNESLYVRLPIDMYLARKGQPQWTPLRLLATQSFEDSDIRKPFAWQKEGYARSAEMLNHAVVNIINRDITQELEAGAKARSR